MHYKEHSIPFEEIKEEVNESRLATREKQT